MSIKAAPKKLNIIRAPKKAADQQQDQKIANLEKRVNQIARPKSVSIRKHDFMSDAYRGTLNKQLSKKLKPMSNEQKTIAMSILNPGHKDNSPSAIGVCCSGTGRIYISKCLMEYTIELQKGCTEIVFFNLPFPEYPFGFTCLVQENNVWTQRFFAIPNQAFIQKDTNGEQFVEAFLKNAGVFTVLPIGISQTIECVQSKMYQKGRSATSRKACDVDCNAPSQNYDEASTSVKNTFVVQDLPTTMNECSKLLGTYDNRDVSLGAYIVSHHNSYTPIKRRYPWEKNPKMTLRPVVGDHRNEIYVKPLNGDYTRMLIYDPSEGGLLATLPALVTGCMDVDMPLACFSNLSSSADGESSFSIKAACTLQFELKASSTLLPNAIPRPAYDPMFLDYILEFESAMSEGGYPADYNFWNKVWPLFKQIWQSGGGNLIGKIPKIGKTAQQIGDLITGQF